MNSFRNLVKDLSDSLGPCSGLDSAHVPEQIMAMMRSYVSNREEWNSYAYADESRGYTRNLVDQGNGKYNLLILVWSPNGRSPIHDHAGSHCCMKILHGSLEETIYHVPKGSEPLQREKISLYGENEVTYMSDELGLHKIKNPDPNNVEISLHLYTPPNAAKHGCYIYDETTSKRTHVKQCEVFSKQGVKCH